MLSPEAKRNMLRIIPFGVIWFVFSIVYLQLEKGMLGDLTYYPATRNPYDYHKSLITTPIVALVTGLFIGTIETLYFSKWFRFMSFSKKILLKSFIYLAVILLFTAVVSFGNAFQFRTLALDKHVWRNFTVFISSYAFWSILLYIASIIIVAQFYEEVSENMGIGVLHKFFTGRYHRPVEEERIYMFLDMKSSTTIAERLGHIRYFQMLRDYYADLSDAIVHYSGEIYQYAGDEVIVSWKPRNGLQNNNCIQCFFAMKAALVRKANEYNEEFGVIPVFKAGFHVGKVTTGEIGVIKKDILFTGDVLNTTERIQSLCNTYKVDNIISADLMKKLDLDGQFHIRTLGENELKGRDQKMELFTIVSA